MNSFDPKTERFFTIMGSMYGGDLRPLAAAIKEGQPVNTVVLYYLALMIDEGLVIAKGRITKRRPRGRPEQQGKSVRDLMAARLYEELRESLSSEDAFRKAANILKTTEATVRKAVTACRSSEK